tara:strand:+ start:672 stop:872 length:201 start_codon:yes stop_codon:yes gene_type:complete
MRGYTMLNIAVKYVLPITEEIEEMASDYGISTQTLKELYSIYDCLDTITLLLDKLAIKDLHKRKIT